jgi:hypothetical protein
MQQWDPSITLNPTVTIIPVIIIAPVYNATPILWLCLHWFEQPIISAIADYI